MRFVWRTPAGPVTLQLAAPGVLDTGWSAAPDGWQDALATAAPRASTIAVQPFAPAPGRRLPALRVLPGRNAAPWLTDPLALCEDVPVAISLTAPGGLEALAIVLEGGGDALEPAGRDGPTHAARLLRFASAVGAARLTIAGLPAGLPALAIPLAVLPRKLGEGADVPAQLAGLTRMLEELAAFSAEILCEWPASSALPIQEGAARRNLLSRLALLRRAVTDPGPGGLGPLVRRVLERPHRRITAELARVSVAELEAPGPDGLLELMELAPGWPRDPHSLRRAAGLAALDERVREDTDTYPNRFVRTLLESVRHWLADLAHQLGALPAPVAQGGAHEARALGRVVQRWLAEPAVRAWSPLDMPEHSSVVLEQDPVYNQLARWYRRLRAGFKIELTELEELHRDPLARVYDLYEWWCLTRLHTALLHLGFEADARSVALDRRADRVRPLEGLALDYRGPRGPLTLWFNLSSQRGRVYRSYSVALKPDFSIEARGHVHLFDAKYKVHYRDLAPELDPRGDPDHSDLCKMHAYRDALRPVDPLAAIGWVLTLYPGTQAVFYPADPRVPVARPDLDPGTALATVLASLPGIAPDAVVDPTLGRSGGVGAVPLLPSVGAPSIE